MKKKKKKSIFCQLSFRIRSMGSIYRLMVFCCLCFRIANTQEHTGMYNYTSYFCYFHDNWSPNVLPWKIQSWQHCKFQRGTFFRVRQLRVNDWTTPPFLSFHLLTYCAYSIPNVDNPFWKNQSFDTFWSYINNINQYSWSWVKYIANSRIV